MRFEEALKQTKFKSENQKAMLNILYTASWIDSLQHCLFKKHQLTRQQYNVLRILRGQHPKPATVAMITERMIDRMSNASRIVDKLVDKKLVERKECSSDRRAVDIIITEKGLNLLTELDPEVNEIFHEKKYLNEEEAQTLSMLLDKMRGL